MSRRRLRYPRVILIVLIIGFIVYNSKTLGYVFFDKTTKYYFHNPSMNNCFTVIVHTGTLWKDYLFQQKDSGRGVYIIYDEFKGHLPDSNYIRLNYIGAIEHLYYKWEKDSLHLRTMYFGIIENKLPSNVVLDTDLMDYEKWGRYHADTTKFVKERLEWQKMKDDFEVLDVFNLDE